MKKVIVKHIPVTFLLLVVLAVWVLSKLPALYCSIRWNRMLTDYVIIPLGINGLADKKVVDNTLWERTVSLLSQNAGTLSQTCFPGSTAARIQGDMALTLGETKMAQMWYDQSLQIDANNPVTLLRLGNLFDTVGQRSEAIRIWRKAGAAPLFYQMGFRRLQTGDADEAYRYLVLAREIDELHHLPSDFYIALSRAASGKGLKDEAEQALHQGITFESSPKQLAKLYAYLGDLHAGSLPAQWEQALLSYQKAVQLSPAEPLWRLGLADAYRMTKQFSLAEDQLQTAQRLAVFASTDIRAGVFVGFGFLYRNECRLDEAAAAFEQALRLSPENLGVSFLLGQTYRLLGRTSDARALLELALQSPNPQIVANAQEEIGKLETTTIDPASDAYCSGIKSRRSRNRHK